MRWPAGPVVALPTAPPVLALASRAASRERGSGRTVTAPQRSLTSRLLSGRRGRGGGPRGTPLATPLTTPLATSLRHRRLRDAPTRWPLRNAAYTLDGAARLAYAGHGVRSRRRRPGRCNGSGGRIRLRRQRLCAP
jgi:hypothetical protein